jgi:aldehyde dehydrogenase (NAD+)
MQSSSLYALCPMPSGFWSLTIQMKEIAMQEIGVDILKDLDLSDSNPGAGTGGVWLECEGEILESISPINGQTIGRIQQAAMADYEKVIIRASEAFREWRIIPGPERGEIVRQIGMEVRDCKRCDFAVGQSRMLYGLSMHSERPSHRMYEQYHPLGPIGVITAFNFPVAVWSWNAMIGLVAGDTVVWKPSSKAPLTALAVMKIIGRVLQANDLPEGIVNVIIGSRNEVGERFISDRRLPLISATGSVAMGRYVGQVVASRLGKSLLELGGNNAVIVSSEADLDLAVRAILFGAVGTAGQRCTTIRRVIAHKDVFAPLTEALIRAYKQVVIGNPLEDGVLMGPLIDRQAVENMQKGLAELKSQGGRILHGGEVLSGGEYDVGTYVTPCICEARNDYPIVQEETFAPILYLIPYENLEEAIQYQNSVPQGLSSAIFTNNLLESERFLSHAGSDCGIANINIGTSGAEIGGAFGGEKDTGGGRESGSDAWKTYMRRQTCTVNWSGEMPLAQGIEFGIE